MKTQMMLPILLLLSACGSNETNADEANAAVAEPEAAAPSGPATAKATNAKLPFDMPIMPGARYLSGSPDFSRPTKRRGGEAIATIAARGTPLDVVKYYEKALADNGFKPEVGKHNSGSSASVSGVRENGEKFSVTSMSGGSKAVPGESQTAIIATKPNVP